MNTILTVTSVCNVMSSKMSDINEMRTKLPLQVSFYL